MVNFKDDTQPSNLQSKIDKFDCKRHFRSQSVQEEKKRRAAEEEKKAVEEEKRRMEEEELRKRGEEAQRVSKRWLEMESFG